jgi:hypothetical protein
MRNRKTANSTTSSTDARDGASSVSASAASAPAASAPGASAMLDRRRFPRVTHRAAFHVRPLLNDGVGEPIVVVLQDLSVSGMGVIHAQPMRVGDQYQVPLTREPVAAGAEALSLVCTVVRCERLDEELFSIGFVFNSPAAAVDEGSRQLTGHPAPRD